jgi:CRP-like cAMP-binding protein
MSDLDEVTRALARVPLFTGLNTKQLRGLAKTAARRKYGAGDEIITQGEGGIGLFVVLSGEADVVHTRIDGESVVVDTFGPTDFFGELAMLHDQPRTATVIATAPTECLVLSRWEFVAELKTDAEMAVVILQELAERFQRTMLGL